MIFAKILMVGVLCGLLFAIFREGSRAIDAFLAGRYLYFAGHLLGGFFGAVVWGLALGTLLRAP